MDGATGTPIAFKQLGEELWRVDYEGRQWSLYEVRERQRVVITDLVSTARGWVERDPLRCNCATAPRGGACVHAELLRLFDLRKPPRVRKARAPGPA